MHWIDPDSLPVVTGKLERFVLNPHGEVDGFIMTAHGKDVLVHTPPHMEAELTRHIKPGEEIGVHGVRPRGANLLAAVAVIAADGRPIVDQGPDDEREHPKHDHHAMDAAGTVRLSLFGPKGELRGALLTDGTVVRIGPKQAADVAGLLAPNAALAVRGDGIETRFGRIVHAREAGRSLTTLMPLKHGKPGPKHKPGPKDKHGPKHEHKPKPGHDRDHDTRA
ncbi:hypothetical protein SSBR45G_51450 [Bradyrhizobium sp. SSBR45G]|uniref:hypothetical protein n=1 Tax=unclassified Bradyrhizobium TaxID=2631580 RepID=UPI002342BB91|nr:MULTISPECIES: hypothetical protein [unclassified Bradyrhizobium]GLH80236.1 hypothetical protein SSBR45G_51450 [Bradyrhizobium sp. SSBR45G]GLH87730.1 hypothetical protein SSBR45R_51900 [Bradyrhizobium sp. SSBR45R]